MINPRMIENCEAVFLLSQKKDIKHFSFDFWNTIAFSNPKFKQKRAELILNCLKSEHSIETIHNAFREIGYNYNLDQEKYNKVESPRCLLEKVFKKLQNSDLNIDIENIQAEIEHLFLDCKPIIQSEFHKIVDHIIKNNKSCSITSNTAFISGKCINRYLNDIGLNDKISFSIFSDEVKCAKPNDGIFNYMYQGAKRIHSSLNKTNIIHIGDNLLTDYYGGLKFGLKVYHSSLTTSLTQQRHSLYSILDTNSLPFDAMQYSKFKFGDLDVAKEYSLKLFNYFKINHLDNTVNEFKTIVIYSSPFDFLPTSSFYLTREFFSLFKKHLSQNKQVNIKLNFGKLTRCQTYIQDYGSMSANERFNLIKNDTYKFEVLPKKR